MTHVEKRWPERSYFLLLLRRVARVVRREAACTRSAVRWLGISPIQRETHGFRATRRSLAALPLKVESSYFRASVSLRVSYSVGQVALGNKAHCLLAGYTWCRISACPAISFTTAATSTLCSRNLRRFCAHAAPELMHYVASITTSRTLKPSTSSPTLESLHAVVVCGGLDLFWGGSISTYIVSAWRDTMRTP